VLITPIRDNLIDDPEVDQMKTQSLNLMDGRQCVIQGLGITSREEQMVPLSVLLSIALVLHVNVGSSATASGLKPSSFLYLLASLPSTAPVSGRFCQRVLSCEKAVLKVGMIPAYRELETGFW